MRPWRATSLCSWPGRWSPSDGSDKPLLEQGSTYCAALEFVLKPGHFIDLETLILTKLDVPSRAGAAAKAAALGLLQS